MFINICIKSKNKNSLIKFLNVFKSFINNNKLKLNKTLNFYQRKKFNKHFTILKSIHVNKTAQEQFEFNLFSKSIKITTFQILKLLIVLKRIQSEFFSDIQIKVKFFINNDLKQKHLAKQLNPRLVTLNSKYNLNQVKLYLLLLNFYGKYTFNRLNSSVG